MRKSDFYSSAFWDCSDCKLKNKKRKNQTPLSVNINYNMAINNA